MRQMPARRPAVKVVSSRASLAPTGQVGAFQSRKNLAFESDRGRPRRSTRPWPRSSTQRACASSTRVLCLKLAVRPEGCLLYTSDAADDLTRVDLGGRRIIKKK